EPTDPTERADQVEHEESADLAERADSVERANVAGPTEPAHAAGNSEPDRAEHAGPTERADDGERADATEHTDRSGDADRGDAERARQVARPSEIDPTLATRDTSAARTADALVALARTALAAGPVPDDADDLTQVVLHVDAAAFAPGNQVARSHLEHGPPVATPTAERLACDATIRPLVHRASDNAVDLALGRTQRPANRAQRRALRTRDGNGCAFPGCAATRHLHAHHVVPWTRDGATDLDNLVLLCRHHHRLHHEGGYHITMTGGRPRFHRPDGTPLQPPPTATTATMPTAQLRHRTHRRGHTPSPNTPRARSGGAPHWSPQCAIDALAS
ncbi:MAG: HNH endonuclease, partial [Acidimicrobiia bacterium]